jgi:hypothetical protein
MFTFMSGCLDQLFQQSGIQLPQPLTAAQLQADPTAPLPPVGGFMNIPMSTFPQSPLLQTRMFAVPQMTTPQAAVTSSFLDQLQMTTPTSSQLPSPLTTGALIFETPACTTLPSPQVSLSYGPPWAHYLGGYQDRLLGGPLGLPGLRYTAPEGVEHKDYGGEVLG